MSERETTASDSKRNGRPRSIVRRIVSAGLWCIAAVLTLWAAAALYFDVRIPWLRLPLSLAYVAFIAIASLRVRRRGLALGLCLAGFIGVLAWWRCLEPSNARDWQPDLALLPRADADGDRITIHGIRNCDYRSETDFDVHHYDKTFDLDKLDTVDLFLVYWGSPLIAHTMLSFGFEDQGYVCISIETRKERGEEYSALRGFFRQYELTYIVADERDLVRLRTNYRQEDVYLYRLKCTPGQARGLFLEYMAKVDALSEKPEWYNAMISNCTTNIRTHAKSYADSPWDWRFLVNGHLDQMLHERGRIVTALPFEEAREQAYINPLAQAADGDPDFSQRIRARWVKPPR